MLEDAGNGMFRLKKEHVPDSPQLPRGFGPADVRFVLNVEISSIYKKKGATRKVHNLVFMPDMESMDRFNARLDRIGNIKSDGRPILGLDCRDLLEIALETTPDSFLIPAHVWTPWFSILGSKSGFDSVEECFEDLASHIFAVETGLSSDPEMNYRVGVLDKFTLISNSDTHSPSKLAREANIFAGEPGYEAIREGIRTGGSAFRSRLERVGGPAELVAELTGSSEGFVGTIEFFPEEGKYHLDGHRKCSVRLDPQETEALGGKCPVCGHAVTVGVMNRVNELADRPPGSIPDKAAPFWRMLPLQEIVAQALDVGPQSKRVNGLYMDLLHRLGPELTILWSLPMEEIAHHAPAIIEEAIRRVRSGEVSIHAGFDGEFGKVELFGPGERDYFAGQDSFLAPAVPRRKKRVVGASPPGKKRRKPRVRDSDTSRRGNTDLNEEQRLAVETIDRPVLVQAGPGTGKTRTLTHRIAALIESGLAAPEEITAVTFTRKAAKEMRDRLEGLISVERARQCWVGTFHQLGSRLLDMLRDADSDHDEHTILDDDGALAVFRQATKDANLDLAPSAVPALFREVSLLKQNLVAPEGMPFESQAARALVAYAQCLLQAGALDLDDLLIRPIRLLQERPLDAHRIAQNCAKHLLVDEFQDVNRAQYEMVRLLSGKNGQGVFAIGDPDQAIYSFRGADRQFFFQFQQDFPLTKRVTLVRNYRSQPIILDASRQVLGEHGSAEPLVAQAGKGTPVRVVALPNASLEGKFIVKTIDEIMGGSSFLSVDSGNASLKDAKLGFRDFAVLFRLNAVGDQLEEQFQASGIPFQRARRAKPEDEAEELDPRAEAVTLMTVHASKGLEFPIVFLAGCEDGVIPYLPIEESQTRSADPDEERRLLYVAMTRAGQELFLTRSLRRVLFGRNLQNPESRFLRGIDGSLCDLSNPLEARRSGNAAGPRQCELFA